MSERPSPGHVREIDRLCAIGKDDTRPLAFFDGTGTGARTKPFLAAGRDAT